MHRNFRLPGNALRLHQTRHRAHIPAPACIRSRDVPDPRFAPVLWMGTKTRRALRRHPARRSYGLSFRSGHRLTGLSSGFPVERPRSGGRPEVSPLSLRHRRPPTAARRPPVVVPRCPEGFAASGSRERSPAVSNRPPGSAKSDSAVSGACPARPSSAVRDREPSGLLRALPREEARMPQPPFRVPRVSVGRTPGRNRRRDGPCRTRRMGAGVRPIRRPAFDPRMRRGC